MYVAAICMHTVHCGLHVMYRTLCMSASSIDRGETHRLPSLVHECAVIYGKAVNVNF